MRHLSISNLAVAEPEIMSYESGKQMNTAIIKKKIEKVLLREEGFEGDAVADLKNHGGAERAVCFYPTEHYSFWNHEFSTELTTAAFGENITVSGLLEEHVCIGDVYQIGEAVVTITQGRVPCNTIDRHTSVKGLFKRVMETGYTGYFAKVLKEGVIEHDSLITLVSRDTEQISVLHANKLFFQQIKNKADIEQLLKVEALAEKWRIHFNRIKEKL